MSGPHKSYPLGQRQWDEQAAAIAFQPHQWPDMPPRTEQPAVAPNPFVRNEALIKEEQ